MKEKRSYTLIELILVVSILTTLALIAIPNYSKSKRRTLQKEAISNMKLIAAGERIYKMEHDVYTACSCTSAADCDNTTSGCDSLLKLMLNTANWTYTVTIGGAACTITATQQTSGSCVYTLNSSDFDSNLDYTSATNCI